MTNLNDEERERPMKLFAWKWVGGGHNQCKAQTKIQARKIGNGMAPGVLVIDEDTFKHVRNEKKFWDHFPIFD